MTRPSIRVDDDFVTAVLSAARSKRGEGLGLFGGQRTVFSHDLQALVDDTIMDQVRRPKKEDAQDLLDKVDNLLRSMTSNAPFMEEFKAFGGDCSFAELNKVKSVADILKELSEPVCFVRIGDGPQKERLLPHTEYFAASAFELFAKHFKSSHIGRDDGPFARFACAIVGEVERRAPGAMGTLAARTGATFVAAAKGALKAT